MSDDNRTSHVRVDRDVLERLKRLTLKKEGCLRGPLQREATQAIREYLHRYNPQVMQQHHIPEQVLRSDVRERIDRAKHAITNGLADRKEIIGEDLYDVLKEATGCRDKRTLRKYLHDLIFYATVLDIKGPSEKIGKFEGEIYEFK